MNTARVNAYAKLNLTLDITGAEGGYHMLDSIVVTIDLCDRIIARKRKDGLVTVTMHGEGSEIPPETNQALRAAEGFVRAFGTRGADLTVYKNIPLGGGLGGSSADAAGSIRALANLYDISDMGALKSLADGYGSDTGYLLSGGLCRITGRGERVERLHGVREEDFHFLVICPRSPVSTAACYARFDERGESVPPRSPRAAEAIARGGISWAAPLFGNALYGAACTLNPDAETALAEAKSFSPMAASMTGSGSAAFCLFDTAELCAWARSRYRGKFRVFTARGVDPSRKKTIKSPFSIEWDERR